MRRWLSAAFALMGVSFTVLQTLMIRELLVSFSGNELTIGLILGSWLLLEALGSGLAGRMARRISPHPASYAWLQVVLSLLLLPSLLAALHARTLLGTVPGEAIPPPSAFLPSLLVLAPLGLVDGTMFTAACRIRLVSENERAETPAGHVYALEAAGSIVGGIALTYLLLPLLSSTHILLLVAVLNLASAFSLFVTASPRRIAGGLAAGLLTAAALVALLTPLATALHRGITTARWAPYNLAYEGNSIYGNVAVIEEYGQITVFANGSPVLTAPDPDAATIELLVHLPALFLQETPRNVLVVGGGAGGVLHELLRYPLEQVDYAELDPLLIQAVRAVPTELTTEELSDPRLRLAIEDGRLFVRRRLLQRTADAGYDMIVLNLPYPSTLVLNRLYTGDFFASVRPLLAPQGILVVPSPPARTYMGPAARDLLACYARTLETVYPHVRAIAGDELTLWLASAQNPLDLQAEELVRRWQAGGMGTDLIGENYLTYLLDEDAASAFEAGLAQGPVVETNRDGHPAGLRYGLAYESAILSPELEPFFRTVGRLRWGHIAAGLGLLSLSGLLLVRRREAVVPVAIVTTGVAGMSADLLVIFAFQVLYGYVYQQVGLLITAFMAGASAGGWIMTAQAGRLRQPWRTLTLLETAVTLTCTGLAGVFALLLRGSTPTSPLQHGLLLATNAVAGALVGLEFPLAHRILTGTGGNPSRAAGLLYAYDLAGATVGAVAVSTVLLPVLGLVETALLVALLKAGSLLLVGTTPWRGRRKSAR